MSFLAGALLLLAVAPAAGGTGFGRADGEALGMPEAVVRLLVDGVWAATPAGFRIIALSHVADGCASQAGAQRAAARRCVARALELAARCRPARYREGAAAEHGLYASHLNLMLGAQDAVGGAHDGQRHDRLSRALAARSLRERTRHVPSFAGSPHRWPADQSATLASLRRHDAAHGGALGDAPAAAWRDWLAAHATTADGLPWSEATGRARHARLPRGCALSFSVRYAAEVDAALAARWWQAYRQRYFVDGALLVGFREWPPDRDLPADIDSGPIVMGVGASATAFALAAARALGDDSTARRIAATSAVVGQAAKADRGLARLSQSTLAQAILFLGQHQPPTARR